MTKPKKTTVACVLAAIAGALVAYFVWAKGALRRVPVDKSGQVAAATQAGREIARASGTPVGDAGSLSNAIQQQVTKSEGAERVALGSLGAKTAEFLAARFGSEDPEAYIAWRREAGYQPASMELLLRQWFIDEAYENYFGTPMPEGLSREELATKMFRGNNKYLGGRSRVVRVATEPPGVAAVTKRLTRVDPMWPRIGGAVGAAFDGSNLATSLPWWPPPVSHAAALAEGKEPLVAAVGFVAEFADGSALPDAVSLIYDDARQTWWVVGMWHGHLDMADTTMLRFEF